MRWSALLGDHDRPIQVADAKRDLAARPLDANLVPGRYPDGVTQLFRFRDGLLGRLDVRRAELDVAEDREHRDAGGRRRG